MPRLSQAMKDVISCDKLGGGANSQAMKDVISCDKLGGGANDH